MGVVDVEPGAVGEDHVGQAEVLVGERLGRVVGGAGVGEAAGVAQRRLLLVVPAGAAAAGQLRAGAVGVDHLGRGDHRVGAGLARHGDAVLDLGTHDPPHRHRPTLRSAAPYRVPRVVVRALVGARGTRRAPLDEPREPVPVARIRRAGRTRCA